MTETIATPSLPFQGVGASDLSAGLTRSPRLGELPSIVHGITGRVVGLGAADGNIGYSPPRDQADAWAMRQVWCGALGIDPEALVTAGQIHGNQVIAVGAARAGLGARPGSGRAGLGDALITDEPGVALLTLHADCLALLLVDPDRPAIAAIHAGWRGTVADVAGATVRALAAHYGSAPGRLLASIGPAIGPCCYDVGPEVIAAWEHRAGGEATVALSPGRTGMRFDLPAANTWLLRRAGVAADRIEQANVCTRCQGERWFSHRGQGATTGRFGAIIALSGT